MNLDTTLLRFGSTFRLLLFVAALIVFIVFLIRNPRPGAAYYLILGGGVMGLIREFRRWRFNRMPEIEQLSKRVSACRESDDE